jgi:hypothetical protein
VTQTLVHGINDLGTIVGSYNSSGDGFVLKQDTYTPFDVPFCGTDTIAFGINALGEIVGRCFNTHAFIWQGSVFTALDFQAPLALSLAESTPAARLSVPTLTTSALPTDFFANETCSSLSTFPFQAPTTRP